MAGNKQRSHLLLCQNPFENIDLLRQEWTTFQDDPILLVTVEE
ncbi:hypothetical protein ACEYW6_33460 [Nostoc sp. UIC 10607]